MSALVTKRIKSAHTEYSHRPETDVHDTQFQQRPITGIHKHKSNKIVLNQAALKSLEQSTSIVSLNEQGRPRTATTTNSQSRSSVIRKLRSDEIESLVQSLEHDEPLHIQVECLADYRTLVQTIDLRRTPLDCQLLCALQQRENRIVQQNACRDKRFRLLMDSLEPSHNLDAIKRNQPVVV
jgi:hypothetical protein